MSTTSPIEIVGGGLAGLSLGLGLQRQGVAATVFEAGDYPRHRVCGEFITGLDERTMERLGLRDLLSDTLRHREVAWFLDDQRARIQQLPVPALGLSRHVLDARLARAFVGAGGTLRVGTRVTERTDQPGRVFATGRKLGRSPWLGLKFHCRRLSLDRDLELHLGDHAYVGLSRIEGDRVNVCGLFRRRPLSIRGPQLLLAYLTAAGFRSLGQRIEAAEIDRESFCAVAALNFDRRVESGRRVQLGDACAMIPPFTGNGMAMAFQSAERALDPLLAFARGKSSWTETRQAIEAALQARFRVRLAAADALHPFLLRPRRQRLLTALSRVRLIPFGPLYSALH
ncbi:MAG: hypothetical protein Q7S40_12385 [Opitutaceae bacterium]|nr:hypothetical protein [Opitutaceae bacterium]